MLIVLTMVMKTKYPMEDIGQPVLACGILLGGTLYKWQARENFRSINLQCMEPAP